MEETWYEELNEWNKALDVYQKKQEQGYDDISVTLGCMRCLEALGEWYAFIKSQRLCILYFQH